MPMPTSDRSQLRPANPEEFNEIFMEAQQWVNEVGAFADAKTVATMTAAEYNANLRGLTIIQGPGDDAFTRS